MTHDTPRANDNINITEALGVKKRKDGKAAFAALFADLERKGMDWTTICECMAEAVVSGNLSRIETMDYEQTLTHEFRVQSVRYKMHDVFMRLKKHNDYYAG